jgi:long-subunit acyl-CoA synthetase (AMP-forming)
MASVTVDLVTHNGAQPASPAVSSEILSTGEIYIDMALLLATSGSTRSPKAVLLSHSAWEENIRDDPA